MNIAKNIKNCIKYQQNGNKIKKYRKLQITANNFNYLDFNSYLSKIIV